MRPSVAEPAAQPFAAFGTKAETLHTLAPLLRHARVLPLAHFTVADWTERREELLDELVAHPWARSPLIVRSSTITEDAADTQQAGRYTSVTAVTGRGELAAAADRVVLSYTDRGHRRIDPADQILVQPMVAAVSCSGVAFTGDPGTGGAYIVVNYHLGTDTTAVTSGSGSADLRTFYYWKHAQISVGDQRLNQVLALARELESLTGEPLLDIEFAFDDEGTLYLLQVRRLPAQVAAPARTRAHHDALLDAADKLSQSPDHPVLLGHRTALGIMPDWNPAEIIGVRPPPLALSLYRLLVTDRVWAESRHRWGYRDVCGCPLMVDIHGLPYIDVRASFNSLLPADLAEPIATRIIDAQLDRLAADPTLHDRVEFEVVMSCAMLDTAQQSRARLGSVLSSDEHDALAQSLRRLTNRILDPGHPARLADDARLLTLRDRHASIGQLDLDPVTHARWLLQDCVRYGTPAFAGYARLGFVAVELLRSIVRTGILSTREADQLLSGLDTVTNQMVRDRAALCDKDFLTRYGHLRPGTYNICSPRYDQAPHLYFTGCTEPHLPSVQPFDPSVSQLRALDSAAAAAGLEYDGRELLRFIGEGIIGREDAKFAFTRHLSDALVSIGAAGAERGLTPDDCSYLDVRVLEDLYQGTMWTPVRLRRAVQDARAAHALSRRIVLPPLLIAPEDVFAFHQPPTAPSFITQLSVTAPIICLQAGEAIEGKILLLPSGDPGYDWIYSHDIAGVITAYGGVNSHMAIRAHQTGVPAVLGVGDTTYQKLLGARVVCIDGINQRIEVLQ